MPTRADDGCRGGGYDRSALIRLPYHQQQLRPSSGETVWLPEVHDSLGAAFRHTRRYESPVTAGSGRTFASARQGVPFSEWNRSLMYGTFRAARLTTPPRPLGQTTHQEVGGFWLVNNRPRPLSAPPPCPPLVKTIRGF